MLHFRYCVPTELLYGRGHALACHCFICCFCQISPSWENCLLSPLTYITMSGTKKDFISVPHVRNIPVFQPQKLETNLKSELESLLFPNRFSHTRNLIWWVSAKLWSMEKKTFCLRDKFKRKNTIGTEIKKKKYCRRIIEKSNFG